MSNKLAPNKYSPHAVSTTAFITIGNRFRFKVAVLQPVTKVIPF